MLEEAHNKSVQSCGTAVSEINTSGLQLAISGRCVITSHSSVCHIFTKNLFKLRRQMTEIRISLLISKFSAQAGSEGVVFALFYSGCRC